MVKYPTTDTEVREIVSLVKDRLASSMRDRMKYEAQWHLNKAFVDGKQYCLWNASVFELQTLKPVPHRQRPVSNIILAYRQRELAKMGRNAPMFFVVPNSEEDSDITAARLGEQVLQHIWRSHKLSRVFLELRTYLVDFGTAFLSVSWDSTGGEYIPVQKMKKISTIDQMTGQPVKQDAPDTEKDGTPKIDEKKSYYEGDVYIEAVSPFAVFVANNNVPGLDKQPWIIKVAFKQVNEVKAIYKDLAKDVKAGDSDLVGSTKLSLMVGGQGADQKGNRDEENLALVIQMQERPCDEFKFGRIVTVTGEVLLGADNLPGMKYDLIQFIRTPISRCFWGQSMVEPSIFHQTEWNKVLASVMEHRETMGKGKWLIPSGAEIKDVINTEHGQLIRYTPFGGTAPTQMRLEALPFDVWRELEIINTRMEDTWSQHEISKAQVPGEVRSGIAIEQLIERDDGPLEPVFTSLNEGWMDSGSRILGLIGDNYTEERVLKVVGEESSPEIMEFKGSDLNGNYDVSVQIGSALPTLKVARQEEVKLRYQLGLYGQMGSPEATRKTLTLLEDPYVISRGNEERMDELNQKREVKRMLQSAQYESIQYYDNHEVHIQTLIRMRKTVAIQNVINQNPQLDELLKMHAREHAEQIAGPGPMPPPEIPPNAEGTGTEPPIPGGQETPGLV